jgi:hypothetical protein
MSVRVVAALAMAVLLGALVRRWRHYERVAQRNRKLSIRKTDQFARELQRQVAREAGLSQR